MDGLSPKRSAAAAAAAAAARLPDDAIVEILARAPSGPSTDSNASRSPGATSSPTRSTARGSPRP
ncbi:hypothetical protein ACP70R_015009 [Stipagrostis hirtigluma subsp. patula]